MGAVLASLGQVAAAGLSIGSLVVEMRAIESYSSSASFDESPEENGQQQQQQQQTATTTTSNEEAALCKSTARAMQNASRSDDEPTASARVHLQASSSAVASHPQLDVEQKCSLRSAQSKSSEPPTQGTSIKSSSIANNTSHRQRDFITNATMTTQNVRVLSATSASKSQARVNVQLQQQQRNKRADDDNDESPPLHRQQSKASLVKRKHLLMLAAADDHDEQILHPNLHQTKQTNNINNNNNHIIEEDKDNTWHRLSLSSTSCLSTCDSSTSSSCSATCYCCHSSIVTNDDDDDDENNQITTNVDNSLDSLFATSCHIVSPTKTSRTKTTKTTKNKTIQPNAITMNSNIITNRKHDIIPDTNFISNIDSSGQKHLNKLLNPNSKSKTPNLHSHSPMTNKSAKAKLTIERTQIGDKNSTKQQVHQKSSKPNSNAVESQSQKLVKLKSQISHKITQTNKLLMSTKAKNNSKLNNDQISMNLWLQRLQEEAMFHSFQQQLTPPMSPLVAHNPLIQDSTYFHTTSPLTPPPTSPSSTSSLINQSINEDTQSSPSGKHAAHLANLMEPPPRPWLQVSGGITKLAGKRASLGGSSDSLTNGTSGQSSLSPHKLRRLIKSGRHHSIDCGIPSTPTTTTTTTTTLPQQENQQQLLTSQTTTSDEFTALSYNVLSDRLVKSDRFPCSPVAALNWLYRRELILQQLMEYSPDILALQELEMEQFSDYFEPTLSSSRHAYSGVFESKSRARTMDVQMRKRVDGCAIFYKRDRFKLVASHLLEFNQLAMANARGSEAMLNRVMTKDNIALVAVLELLNRPSPSNCAPNQDLQPELLIICNTHIYWDPEFCDVKLVQTIMLMNELKCIAQHYQKNSMRQPSLILLGDFNSLPKSGVTNYLLDGQIDSLHEDFKHFRYTKCTNSLVTRSLTSSTPEVAAHSHATTTLAPPVRRPALMRTASNTAGETTTSITKSPAATADLMIDCPPTQIANHHLRRQSSPMFVATSVASPSLTCHPSPVLVVQDEITEDTIIYEHPFRLQSAYGMGGASMMPFTNYTTKFKATIDYIFYAHDSLEPIGLLGPLDKRWLRGNRIKGFPQLHLPSDHLPLLVKFRFTNNSTTSSAQARDSLVMPTVMRLRNKRRPTSSSSGSDLATGSGSLRLSGGDDDTMSSSSSQVSASITSGGDQFTGNSNHKKQQKQKENLLSTQSQREKQKLRKQQQQGKKITDEGDKQINFNNQQHQHQQQHTQRPIQRRLNTYDYQHANSSVGSSSSSPALWAGSYASASKMAANQQRDLHNNRPPKRHQLFRSQQQNQQQQQQQQRVWLKSWSGPTASSSLSSSVLIKQHSERWS